MGIYARHVLPRLIDLVCRSKINTEQRRKVVPRATGRVLEIGAGSGLNLPHYDPTRVERLYALEPSEAMWALAADRLEQVEFPVEPLRTVAEQIPLGDDAVDTVLVTFSLCTIPDASQALAEIRRVLRDDGQILFCEHGLAPDENVRRWQGALNPVWSRLAGGCNLNRDIPSLLTGSGFRIREIETGYLQGPRPLAFNYCGMAE